MGSERDAGTLLRNKRTNYAVTEFEMERGRGAAREGRGREREKERERDRDREERAVKEEVEK